MTHVTQALGIGFGVCLDREIQAKHLNADVTGGLICQCFTLNLSASHSRHVPTRPVFSNVTTSLRTALHSAPRCKSWAGRCS